MRRFILLSFLAFPAFAADEPPPKLEAVPEQPELPLPCKAEKRWNPTLPLFAKVKIPYKNIAVAVGFI